MSIEKEKLELACFHLKIECFQEDEYAFLREYHQVIKPVALALKTLESNQNSFGVYLPILFGFRKKMNDLRSLNIIYCDPLITAIEDGFEKRFGDLLNTHYSLGTQVPLFVAMATNPQYKLNYMGLARVPSHTSQKIRNMLQEAAKEIVEFENRTKTASTLADVNTPATATATQAEGISQRNDDDYSTLLVENDVSSGLSAVLDVNSRNMYEIENWLCLSTDPDIKAAFKDFPLIKKLFMKFNCIRSSEAICERLFSYAGMFTSYL